MKKLFIVMSCWFLGFSGSSLAWASGNKLISLPAYNPIRYRVPANPEAQALHQKILKVSKDLATLKAVSLEDPSIEPRFAQMIAVKIQSISAKLEVLKVDMKRRQEAEKASSRPENKANKNLKKSSFLPKEIEKTKIEKTQPRKRVVFSEQTPQKTTSEEIKALKISLQGILKKLEVLEQKNKARYMETGLKTKEEDALESSKREISEAIGLPSIPLPVRKKVVMNAPKLVRTTAIYPTPIAPSNGFEKGANFISFFPEKRPNWDITLPLEKPVSRQIRTDPWKKKKRNYRKFVSVEDPQDGADGWSEQSVFKAKQQCVKLFQNLNINYTEKAAIKKGRCGTPGPIYFRGFGTRHKVTISPPATINCKTTAVIANWMNKKVQPLALKLLGSPIAKIHNVASYNCRNRYGRKNGRISEHAYANALDIMAFTTQKGEKIDLLQHFYEDNEKGKFLRTVHRLACKDKFGTVLGPEANAAHKNHFHLDLAKRRRSAYCE